ncbi:MAG: hypothetical protein NC409_04370 [Clostridium sp.]|nr:hypothetical protein [Clostridium sp.]
MRIETAGGAYHVIRVLKKELSLCSYLAGDAERGKETDNRRDDGRRILLLEMTNPALARNMMPVFLEMREAARGSVNGERDGEGSPFPDFVDCFVKEKAVWAAFRYHEGIPLSEAAARASSHEERMLLWEGLLERLFLQKIPPYLRYEAANPANIVVDTESAVWVNYELYDTDRLHDDPFCGLQRRLYESFCLLFGADGADGMTRYAKKLAGEGFGNETALYRESRKLRTLTFGEEDGGKKEGVILLRAWRFVLGHTEAAVKCVCWVVMLVLWGVFFWLCTRPQTAPEERERIMVIGTVEAGEPERDAAE